ncbi:FIST signal transduction protein [Sulfoacidibacillus ferrooxidans]|uniref:FIST domain containing protein n=1 Tax=Sulfoacidibacillus ferrooxidans TaxID=2005001 RepID=A0A9X2ACX2_9BACL|nr:FIST N-terminal domain-containing protein [Sulfoacidibacillus ferrooxidans]MCI0182785.1 hypothetical protein [Sulfoacidibacillus ferrooxidans]
MDIGIGVSNAKDTYTAIREAVSMAQMEAHELPDMILLFASAHYDPEILVTSLSEAFPHVMMVGCTTAGELSPLGFSIHSCVVVTLRSSRHRFGVAIEPILQGKENEAGFLCAQKAYEQVQRTDPYSIFLLLTDGLSPNQQEILEGAYTFCGGDIPIIGGAAGDDRMMNKTYQFLNGKVYSHVAVGMFMQSMDPIGVGVRHGWQPHSRLLRVTRAEGSLVYELDGKPAVQTYLDVLGADALALSSSRISRIGQNHPLGMISTDEQYEIRHVLREQGDALLCFGSVRDGALIAVMGADTKGLLKASAEALDASFQMLGSLHEPQLAIVFSCVARANVLDEAVSDEWNVLQAVRSGVPLVGLYSYGEFARLHGRVGYYNGSVVCLAL